MSNNNKNLLGSASTPLPRLIARRPEASADDGGRRARTLPRLPALSPHAEKMEEMQQHTNSNNNVPSSSSAPITFVLRPRPSLPSMETTTSLQSINASSASSPVVVVARRGGGGGGGGGGAGADAENQLRREFHPPSLPNIIIAQMPRNLAAVAGRRTTNPARTTMMVVPVPTSSPTYASPNRCSSHSSSCSPSPRHRCGGDESDIVWAPLPSLQHVGDQPPSQQQQQHVGGGGGGSCCPSSSSSTMLVFHAQTPPREHSTSEALDARTAIFMAKQRTSKPMGGGGGAGQQHQLTAQSQPAPTISGFHQHLRNSLTRPTARMWDVRHSATIPTIGELIASHPLNAVAQQYAHLHDLQMLFNDMIHELAQARPACGDVRGWIRRWLEQQKTPSSTSSSTDVVEDVAGVSITAVVQAGAAATHHHHVPLTMPMEEASSSPLHSSPSPPDSARSDAEDLRVVYRSVLRQHGDWLREQSRQAPSPPRSNTSTNNSSSINVMSVPPTTSSLSVVEARRPPPPPYTPTRVESGGGGRPHLQPATNAAAANHTHHDGSGGSSPVLTNNFGRTDESGSTSANKAKLFSPPAHHHHTPHSGSSGTG